jgi:hypothetical protein
MKNNNEKFEISLEGIFEKGYGQVGKVPIEDKRLTDKAKIIYTYICTFAGGGKECFTSAPKLCAGLNINKDTFWFHLKYLIAYGYIRVLKKPKTNSNHYQIVFNPVENQKLINDLEEEVKKKYLKRESSRNKNNKTEIVDAPKFNDHHPSRSDDTHHPSGSDDHHPSGSDDHHPSRSDDHHPSGSDANSIFNNNKNNKLNKKNLSLEISNYLFEKMKRNNPKVKKPKFNEWKKEIIEIIESDKRNIEDIYKVIDYSQNNDFWMTTILTPTKLRLNFDQLYLKMIKENDKKIDRKNAKQDTSSYYDNIDLNKFVNSGGGN